MYSSDVLICVHMYNFIFLYLFVVYWFVAPVVFFSPVHCLQVQMCLHRSSLLIILVLVNLFLF